MADTAVVNMAVAVLLLRRHWRLRQEKSPQERRLQEQYFTLEMDDGQAGLLVEVTKLLK